ncbi:MAG: zf-HC2 domain-containing protein [Acidobacteria bacterium]|nr:zf-HC2 domain-containing protein [Acidobacteriota bacterium]
MTAQHGPASRECRELFARLSEYLDGELDPAVCEETDKHLEDCSRCQKFLESLRRTVVLVNRLPGEPLPEETRRQIRESFRRLKKDLRL